MGNLLGIDPSTVASGYSVLNHLGELLDYGVIKPNKNKLNEAQQAIYQYTKLKELMETHDIKMIACEDQHRGPNADTFKKLSRVSGYVILLAGQFDVPISIYQPSSWRKLTHGKGNVNKAFTRQWVNDTYNLSFKKKDEDITDSIGIAHALLNQINEENITLLEQT